MTKFKKGAIAAFAAVLAATGITAAALPHNVAGINYAAAETVSVEGVDLDITDNVLGGFASDATIPSSVKLVIPEGVTSIKENAFEGCTQIISVTLPSTLTSIGQDAFKDCTRIIEVVNKSALVDDGEDLAFQQLVDNATVKENEESVIFPDENGFLFLYFYDGVVTVSELIGYNGTQTELTLPENYDGNPYVVRESAFAGGDFTAVYAQNADIEEIRDSAFENCAKLESVALPATGKLTTIGDSAFENCALLKDITFPRKSVTPPDEESDGPVISGFSIYSRAFAGCGITVLDFIGVECDIYGEAFADCENLSVAYVSADVGFNCNMDSEYDTETGTWNATYLDTLFFNENTIIIVETDDNFSYYNDLKTNPGMVTHSKNVTFIVDITFDGGAGGYFEWQRLAGKSLNYVKNADGSWGQKANIALPVQDGYKVSRWYADTDYTNPVNINDVTDDLKTATGNELKYYARYFAIPEPSLQSLTFDENKSYTAYDFIVGNINEDYDDAPLAATVAEIGDDGKLNILGTVSNAGVYTLVINIADTQKYGEWKEQFILPDSLVIERKFVEFSGDVHWQSSTDGVAGVNDLVKTGSVFVYAKGEDRLYSSSVLKVLPAGYTLREALTVTDSIVRYKKSEVTLTLNDTDIYYGNVSYTDMIFNGVAEPDGINANSQTGRYEAKAIIKVSPNYLIQPTANINDTAQGLTVTFGDKLSNDGATSVLVTKVWYLLDLGNWLVFKDNDEPFKIDGWRYNEGEDIAAPGIEICDDNTEADATFTLVKDGVNIGGAHSFTSFTDCVNASMPAGNYTLTFNIPAVYTKEGELDYLDFTDTYSFTVLPAKFIEEKRTVIKGQLVSGSWSYTGGVILYDWQDEISDSFNPERKGIWAAGGAYDNMYSERYQLKYNFARMQSSEYLPRSEFVNRNDLFKPVAPDTYIVYYQLEAKNYEPLVDPLDDAARREYRFEEIIYGLIETPRVEELTYTGLRVLPYVAEDPRYKVIYDESETSYINAVNDYSVTLEIIDGVHYKWLINGEKSEDTVNVVKVKINRADNSEKVGLSIPQWQSGNYSPDIHIPVWGTFFSDDTDKDFYTYKLLDKDGNECDFASTAVGTYTLVATAKGYKEGVPSTYKYNWNEYVKTLTVTVDKGSISFTVTPNVMQWRFGGYNPEVNLVLAEVTGDSPVKFKVTYDKAGDSVIEGLEEFTSQNGLVAKEVGDVFAGFKVGTYYLWASVDETEMHHGLNPAPFEFTVTIAQNYWEEAPSIATWVEGTYDEEVNIITAISRFGSDRALDVVITVAGDSENVVYDSVNGINNLKGAKVGAYELKASLAGTSDYTDLTYSFTFQIFHKQGLPWWAVLLIVVGTVGVIALVFFILHQKGVLQMLTGKIVLSMRAKATIDATIAAVRANKVAEEAKKSVALAKQRELEEEQRRLAEEQAVVEEKPAEAPAEEQPKPAKKAASKTKKKTDGEKSEAKPDKKTGD
ncbi:MAG: leucine-rich repeat protein [Clostridia bacterium]|nr:leucine-rich repeat protein [Clostridia bacterium]